MKSMIQPVRQLLDDACLEFFAATGDGGPLYKRLRTYRFPAIRNFSRQADFVFQHADAGDHIVGKIANGI